MPRTFSFLPLGYGWFVLGLMMRIFLLGSKGFHTRVGSPSTCTAVGMGPVFVMSLGSVATGAGVLAAGSGVCACVGVERETTGGIIVGAVGSGAGAGSGEGAGAGAGVITGAGISVGCVFSCGAGAGAVAAGAEGFVGAVAGAEMNDDGVGAFSQLVVCTGSSCGVSAGATGRGLYGISGTGSVSSTQELNPPHTSSVTPIV